jgi:hypothetical protein
MRRKNSWYMEERENLSPSPFCRVLTMLIMRKFRHNVASCDVWGPCSIDCTMHHISAEVMDTYEGGRRAETERVQQATEADWLTSACDFKCAEPSKTRPPSSVVVICFGRWRAERDSK